MKANIFLDENNMVLSQTFILYNNPVPILPVSKFSFGFVCGKNYKNLHLVLAL